MKAGRELDALVAEKVMGECAHVWGYRFTQDDDYYDYPPKECIKCKTVKAGLLFRVDGKPHCNPYSTDIAAAWEVVDRLYMSSDCDGEAITEIAVYKDRYGNRCEITCGRSTWIIEADTAPLAICLAAIKAIGCDAQAKTEDTQKTLRHTDK